MKPNHNIDPPGQFDQHKKYLREWLSPIEWKSDREFDEHFSGGAFPAFVTAMRKGYIITPINGNPIQQEWLYVLKLLQGYGEVIAKKLNSHVYYRLK